MYRITAIVIVVLLMVHAAAHAQNDKVLFWPNRDNAILVFAISPFHNTGVIAGGKQQNYSADIRVQSLWTKPFSASFRILCLDKDDTQIGEAPVFIRTIKPGEKIALPVYFTAVGVPFAMRLEAENVPSELAQYAAPREITINVHSVPEGASLKLDGQDAGVTPKAINVSVGPHSLEFTKEGFDKGVYPLDIRPDEASGGQITLELGMSHDMVEMRDGTVLSGDLLSMSAADLVIMVDGKQQKIKRNDVKRISLVQRVTSK